MRAVFITALLVASTAAWPQWANDAPAVHSTAEKQKDFNDLLFKVTEPIHDDHLPALCKSYDLLSDVSIYTDGGKAAKNLHDRKTSGHLLERHHYFSLFDTEHREDALSLFKLLITCSSYECYVKNACYYRNILNEGAFVYGIFVSTTHSDLTHHLVHPPLYEIMPHLFTNSEIINKAYEAQMTQTDSHFYMSFTGSQKNPEQRVAYFGEDIGMNTHHVTWHMDYPFWWDDTVGNHHLSRKGELFYYMHHQLTARFDAERLSNNLNKVDELHWDKPIVEGFAPHTTYRYGGEFPSRPDNINFVDVDGVARVRDMLIIEDRIRDSIAHGYVEDHAGNHISLLNDKGIDVLGDIIESSMYSPNVEYYGALHNTAHVMLGRQADPRGKFNQPPGVMEHFETATRDPSFFRLHKYMDNIFKEHKDTLPSYTEEELTFEGIAIDSVKIDGKLSTYFENFTFDISQAVDSSANLKPIKIDTDTPRLNHEHFAYNFDVVNNNGEDKQATFRVFLCPRRDFNHILNTFDEGRVGCIEVDKFVKTLSVGHNNVVRKDVESSVTVPDRLSYNELVKRTNDAITAGSVMDTEGYERGCGIPHRLLLPKGKPEGMEFGLLVAVSDASKDWVQPSGAIYTHALCGVHGEQYPDSRPLGYPLDRKIPDPRVINHVRNFYYKDDLHIFHVEH